MSQGKVDRLALRAPRVKLSEQNEPVRCSLTNLNLTDTYSSFLRDSADTITIPDDEMLRLMATASVGDDVYKQDRATNDLQARIAKLAGKEAALFVVSGTMSNRKLRTCYGAFDKPINILLTM